MSLVDDNLTQFLFDNTPLCEGETGELQHRCYEEGLPIIPPDVRALLGVVLGILKPRRILEIGMAVGFSASYMSSFLPKDGKLITIDRYPEMIERARENFKLLKVEDRVELIVGDANEVLKKMDDEFDFVLMDAAKGQYINILPDVLRLTRVGGVILTDDIFQNGQVALPPEKIAHRNRTIYNRLNEFIEAITTDERLNTALLTIGDGVALMQKIKD